MLRYVSGVTLLLMVCLVSLAAAEDPPRQPQKFALLVGVNQYSDLRELECAARDQWALAGRLEQIGFPKDQIIVLASQLPSGENNDDVKRLPIQRNMLKWLSNIVDLTHKGDTLIVAFSGHGIQIGDHNYLCPIDADPEDPQHTMINVELLNAKLKASDATLKLLVLDACRDDPRPPGKRSAIGDVRFEYGLPPDGVVSIRSCSKGKTAREDDKLGHGVFMHYFLQGLDGKAADDEGTVTLGRLFDYVSRETDKYVVDKFGDVQRPVMIPERVEQVTLVRSSDRRLRPASVEPNPLIPARDIKPGQVHTNSLGMKLALIPAGDFQMGSGASEADRGSDELAHRVRITKPFYLGVYEVTQGEYEQLMGTNPSYFSSIGGGKERVAGLATGRFPVENVSWEDAVEFCRRLSTKEGREYRLPTEAEWEYACRAGSATEFEFGSELDGRQANCDGNYPYGVSAEGPYLKRTTQVGSYKPNGFGLYDMHGNVWERCSDWYGADYYGASPAVDPRGTSSGSYRVLRGGGWSSLAVFCRSAYRSRDVPSYRDINLGFRVSLVP